MNTLTFDEAIEILEIVNISQITDADLPRISRTARGRWHPDRISHGSNPAEIDKYTENFKQVEQAVSMVAAFLNGTYQSDKKFENESKTEHPDPIDLVRSNADRFQREMQEVWGIVKSKGFKKSTERVELSDGFVWKDLLNSDFQEDIAKLSFISLIYGFVIMSFASIVGTLIHPVLGWVIQVAWLPQALSCILGLMPLSRFWLPEKLQEVMLKFINSGLFAYNLVSRGSETANGWIVLLVQAPALFASLAKWIVLWPLTEIAKMILGDKRVGMVHQEVTYFGGVSQLYVDELLSMPVGDMDEDQLFDLAGVHSELNKVRSH